MILKIDHTARVCENIRHLARSLIFSEANVNLAEAVALFHDVGRFEQYRKYQTFNDSLSVNHAQKSVDVLTQRNVLDPISEREKKIIIDAVRFHNAPALPDDNGSDGMIFMRLIRDADKLDIWKVFADYFRRDAPHNPIIVQHLVDAPTWEQKLVAAILEKRPARFKDMKTIHDFKLFQLSWVFSLNFPATAVLARERGDLATIAGTLPADPVLEQAVWTVMDKLAAAEC